MALEIQIAAMAKSIRPEQRVNHAHYFRAFFINGHGVEIGNLLVGIGLHRVRGGAGILGELGGTQQIYVLHPLDGARTHVGGELAVAKHREAFFQAQGGTSRGR